MNLSEFEDKLQTHAQSVKNHMTSPIIEREVITMKNGRKISITIVLIAAVICVLGTTVFAAYQYLSAKQAADYIGDAKLAEHLEGSSTASETITDGDYRATLLGITSGKNLSDFKASSWDLFPERTYSVIAIERTDSTDITYDDQILVSPLIEGLKPWQYNIYTMNGSYVQNIIDGVLYRIVEFDSIEYFADRHVYLAVLSNAFYDTSAYNYDEQTGLISVNENYDGTNILFDLALDKSKANPEKAAEYLNRLAEAADNEEDGNSYAADDDTLTDINLFTDTESVEAE